MLYIGRATSLRSRVASYWGDLRDRQHLAPMVGRVAAVEAAVCASEHEAAWLERNLLECSLPRWNRTAGGQEVAVCIALRGASRAPALKVVHADAVVGADDGQAGVRYFGPYLGGARVRLAAAGLHRVLPLGYAGDGQRGTVADLAQRRGVGSSDRAALVAALTAVLDRDPGAVSDVRARLTQRRDAAAAAERYELAGRIQEELTAVGWVVCTQRAAVLAPEHADVAAWAAVSPGGGRRDGILVTFEVRGGRLRGWRQLACSRRQAERPVAATPPKWRDFAQRNAELAALLSRASAANR